MLSVTDLAVSYRRVPAVSEVSLTVGTGELVALLGANGAGKTTTLHAIMGLLPPTRGSVRFGDRDLAGMPSRNRVDLGLAIVPEGRQLFPDLTVQENLEVSFSRSMWSRLDRTEFDRRLDEMAEYFPRVIERRRQLAGSLSGGEQQMVALARAVMSKPKLLLLDEPSLGLSPIMIETVMSIVRRLNDAGLAILLVEQNAEAALELADTAYVLESGATVLSGPARDVAGNPRVQQAYLGL